LSAVEARPDVVGAFSPDITVPGPGERRTLDALTTLRFVAAFRIMMFHMVRWDAQPFVLRSLVYTPLGVSYFFVASGFLLTYVYGEASDRGWMSVGRFWRKRCWRLLPVYYIGLVVAIPLLVSQHDLSASKIVATLLLVQAWFPSIALYWNFPAWALSALLFFYVTLPGVLRLTRRTTTRGLIALAIALWLIGIACGVAYVWLRPDGLSHVDWHTRAEWLHVLKFNPLVRLPEFLLGVCAGRLFLRRGGFGRFSTWAFGAAVIITVAALLAAQLLPYPVASSGLLDPLLVIILVSLATDGPVARFLSRPALVQLGRSSFCLYMVHAPLLYLGWTYAPSGWRHSTVYLMALIPTIIGISFTLYQWVERPLTNHGR
jgi:peptidoglycan/LPS O-acetylase OafA/YrhL